MNSDQVFNYVKLVVENFPFWAFLLVGGVWLLIRNPDLILQVRSNITSLTAGPFTIEFAKLQAQVEETKEQVKILENDVERERTRFNDILNSFDPHASVSELAHAREELKSIASAMQDLSSVRKGLGPGASAEAIYAAAEVARERRDIALFDDIVRCLDRISRSIILQDVRLYTVWTLTSALHRTLIAGIKYTETPQLSREQLEAARSVLSRLIKNPRVIADRPDSPMRGVRGPAKWASDWIDKGISNIEKNSR